MRTVNRDKKLVIHPRKASILQYLITTTFIENMIYFSRNSGYNIQKFFTVLFEKGVKKVELKICASELHFFFFKFMDHLYCVISKSLFNSVNRRNVVLQKNISYDADKWCFKYGLLVGCMFESNCPLVGPGTIGGIPSVRVFLRDPSPYLREFWRKPRKTPNG